MYCCNADYNSMALVEFEVERETPKLYIVKQRSERVLVGSQYSGYIGRQIHKDARNVFADLSEAVRYLVDQGENKRQRIAAEMENIEAQIAELKEVLSHIQSQ